MLLNFLFGGFSKFYRDMFYAFFLELLLFNIFVGMGSGYALRALPQARASLLPG